MAAPADAGMWTTLLTWFNGAGDEVKAALIGNAGIAFAAFLTVVGTAIFATRQYRQERLEKARDRALAVKNGILFDSIRGASEAMVAMSGLADLRKDSSTLAAEFQKGISAITVSFAVGDIATVKAGRDFLDTIGPVFIKRVIARKPLEELRDKIQMIGANIDSQHHDNNAMLAMQRDAIVGGDHSRASQASELFQIGRKLFDGYAAEHNEVSAELKPLHEDYLRENLAANVQVVPTFHSYIAAVRKDIGIDVGGPDEFLDAAHIDPREPLKALRNALDELKSAPNTSKEPA